MTNYGDVLGTWGADQRNFNDSVGARSQMLRRSDEFLRAAFSK